MATLTQAQTDQCLYGPLCHGGCGKRTRNPSKRCSDCLGREACPSCRGTGRMRPPHDFYACLTCPGTGKATP